MITGVFGLPGSGKSTFLAWCASCAQAGKRVRIGSLGGVTLTTRTDYDKIYSNFPIRGCYPLDFDKLGVCEYSDCLILIDEVSLLADSRAFKTFNDTTKMFFTMHRHWGVDVIWCGQSYMDCDVKIRRITEQLMFIESSVLGRSKITPIFPVLGLDDSGKIEECYVEKGFFSRKYLRRKPYYHMFDSFQRPSLRPLRSGEPWPFDDTPHFVRGIKRGGRVQEQGALPEKSFSHMGGKPPHGNN